MIKKIYYITIIIFILLINDQKTIAQTSLIPQNFAQLEKEEKIAVLKRAITIIKNKIEDYLYEKKIKNKKFCKIIIKPNNEYAKTRPQRIIKWPDFDPKNTTEIENIFNKARKNDKSTGNKRIILPKNRIWKKMSKAEKALYIINSERQVRNLQPFEAISREVNEISMNFAKELRVKSYFNHYRKSDNFSPWDRIDENKKIRENSEWYEYAENLYIFAYIGSDMEVVESIYNWIYDDKKNNSKWGHRDFILSENLNDNSGNDGSEGLIGLGFSSGKYNYFSIGEGTVIVLNAFDPDKAWKYGNEIYVKTEKSNLCN